MSVYGRLYPFLSSIRLVHQEAQPDLLERDPQECVDFGLIEDVGHAPETASMRMRRGGRHPWLWFIGLWLASVLTMAAVSYTIRLLMFGFN